MIAVSVFVDLYDMSHCSIDENSVFIYNIIYYVFSKKTKQKMIK